VSHIYSIIHFLMSNRYRSLGLDLIWLGVLYVPNMEIGLITPPVGINLFLGVTVAFPQLSVFIA